MAWTAHQVTVITAAQVMATVEWTAAAACPAVAADLTIVPSSVTTAACLAAAAAAGLQAVAQTVTATATFPVVAVA